MDQSVTWNVTGGLSFDHRSKILPPSAWDTTKFLPQRSFVQTTEGFWLLHFLSCETPLRNKRWWWFQIFLLCSPQSLGKWSNLIIFFQMGWFNHELGRWNNPLIQTLAPIFLEHPICRIGRRAPWVFLYGCLLQSIMVFKRNFMMWLEKLGRMDGSGQMKNLKIREAF